MDIDHNNAADTNNNELIETSPISTMTIDSQRPQTPGPPVSGSGSGSRPTTPSRAAGQSSASSRQKTPVVARQHPSVKTVGRTDGVTSYIRPGPGAATRPTTPASPVPQNCRCTSSLPRQSQDTSITAPPSYVEDPEIEKRIVEEPSIDAKSVACIMSIEDETAARVQAIKDLNQVRIDAVNAESDARVAALNAESDARVQAIKAKHETGGETSRHRSTGNSSEEEGDQSPQNKTRNRLNAIEKAIEALRQMMEAESQARVERQSRNSDLHCPCLRESGSKTSESSTLEAADKKIDVDFICSQVSQEQEKRGCESHLERSNNQANGGKGKGKGKGIDYGEDAEPANPPASRSFLTIISRGGRDKSCSHTSGSKGKGRGTGRKTKSEVDGPASDISENEDTITEDIYGYSGDENQGISGGENKDENLGKEFEDESLVKLETTDDLETVNSPAIEFGNDDSTFEQGSTSASASSHKGGRYTTKKEPDSNWDTTTSSDNTWSISNDTYGNRSWEDGNNNGSGQVTVDNDSWQIPLPNMFETTPGYSLGGPAPSAEGDARRIAGLAAARRAAQHAAEEKARKKSAKKRIAANKLNRDH